MLTERQHRPPLGALARPDVVPYIAQWSEEHVEQPVVIGRAGGIAYADEVVQDRDGGGVLWSRFGMRPGRGRPEFGKVHGLRQRRTMRRLLCQVCGDPADENDDGVLWLLGEDPDDPDSWPEKLETSHPPLCLPCAATSVRLCPHLSKHYAALRVRDFHLAGVWGALYRAGFPLPVKSEAAGVSFDDPRVRWVRASQLIMRLDMYTVVDLEAEVSRSAATLARGWP
ncbi:hypothetical protein [Streptomyces sp. NBRC 109706]|uniref:hypothetical protein n=1 Tax=Streptomyces sp. NBRC 109706 TaxID=1550035 RepID=UPI00078521F8|nr:hypothetical protein [Streptomyces sp. NBRC 109706]